MLLTIDRGGVMRVRATVVVLVMFAGALGACGKDSISKTDFIAAAGKICKGIDTKLLALDKSVKVETEPTPEQQQTIVKGAGVIFKDAADELTDLGLPSDDKDTVKAFVAAMHAGADEVISGGATPEKSAVLLASDKDPLEKANDLADEYGITECGKQ
ncbi:MAG: hypothetical protein ACSLFB_12465 [Acidimicrobiales bacterium]